MKVTKLSNAVINTDGSTTMVVTVMPETNTESAFLGYCVAAADLVPDPATAVAAIEAEAQLLGIMIPSAQTAQK